jgi:seryl-tRNA synthetase
MYMDEILPEEVLPIRYVGYSSSFRREAGSYGKDTEGIIRMHQFDKLEMEVFSTPETGLAEHFLLVAIQEYLVQQLGLPYQLIQKCTADIGKPDARGIDINTWMPGQGKYRETHTADYMTDYQARRLKTRVKRNDGSTQLVHINDATAFALGRIMVAIMENYQTADGHIEVPEALRPFMAGRTEI